MPSLFPSDITYSTTNNSPRLFKRRDIALLSTGGDKSSETSLDGLTLIWLPHQPSESSFFLRQWNNQITRREKYRVVGTGRNKLLSTLISNLGNLQFIQISKENVNQSLRGIDVPRTLRLRFFCPGVAIFP